MTDMSDLQQLRAILHGMEEDIQQASQEIEHQREVIRKAIDPIKRNYARRMLGGIVNLRSDALVKHEQISREIAEKSTPRQRG
jgi:hypothetical protein